MSRVILGTRGSKLALAQSSLMAATLSNYHPGLTVELQVITTKGDRILDVALSAVGDKGLFVKELEQALLDEQVDLCVHSGKDLPSHLPADLTLAVFPKRADPRDVLVLCALMAHSCDPTRPLEALPTGAIIGTSSLRRISQLRALRPDLELRDVRGNVDTRLRKLAEGQYAALVLAAAGLQRLDLLRTDGTLHCDGVDFVALPLDPSLMLPAVAQGTLAIECRADDAATMALLAPLDHGPTRATALAERALLRRLEGGCQVPIAAYATIEDQQLYLQGLVGSLDGQQLVRAEVRGAPADAEALGTALAEQLLAQGAAVILAALSSS
ncbi:MAG: hydroxymethylbilane synthase [Oscillochloridaceae bacterium umkhey_bin13]